MKAGVRAVLSSVLMCLASLALAGDDAFSGPLTLSMTFLGDGAAGEVQVREGIPFKTSIALDGGCAIEVGGTVTSVAGVSACLALEIQRIGNLGEKGRLVRLPLNLQVGKQAKVSLGAPREVAESKPLPDGSVKVTLKPEAADAPESNVLVLLYRQAAAPAAKKAEAAIPSWDLEFSGVLPGGVLVVRAVDGVPFHAQVKKGDAVYAVRGKARKEGEVQVDVSFSVQVAEDKNSPIGQPKGTRHRDASTRLVLDLNGPPTMFAGGVFEDSSVETSADLETGTVKTTASASIEKPGMTIRARTPEPE